MSYITDFPHTRTYDSDLGFLIEEYKRLNGSYEILAQIYDLIKQNIKDITLEQLQEWLDDGTIENLLLSLLNVKIQVKTFNEYKTGNNFIENQFIETNGFNIEDGQGATYIVKKGTPTNYNDIALNSEYYATLLYPLENGLAYGLDNTGINDCSEKINNILKNQSKLFLYNGIYNILTPIIMNDNNELYGNGKFKTIINVTTINNGIQIYDKTFCKIHDIQIKGSNKWDDGVPLSQNGQNGIYIADGNDHIIENCVVWQMQETGLKIDYKGRQTPIQIVFNNMYVKNNSKYGLYALQVHGLQYNGNNLEHNGISNIYLDVGCIDVDIRNINCNFTDKMTGSVIDIENEGETDTCRFTNIHIEDNGTLNQLRQVPCIKINANICVLECLYIRYTTAFTYAIECLKRATILDSVFRNMQDVINILPTTGVYLRGNRSYNITGTFITGSGGIYNDNFIPRTVISQINFNKENMNYNVDCVIEPPYLSRYIYTAKIKVLTAISVISNCRIDYYLYDNNFQLLGTSQINISDFANNQYDITTLMRTKGLAYARFQLITTNATGNANILIDCTGV